MNIAYVANIRMPTEKGHGIQIMEMCRAFARNGHRVRLIVPKRKNIHAQTPWSFYGFQTEFEIVEVPIFDFISYDRLLGRVSLWLNTLQFLVMARHAVNTFKPDLVYAREPWYGSLASDTPHVFEAHDFTARVTPFHRRWWGMLARIVTVTQGLKKTFVDHGVPEEKIVVAHDGVDLKAYEIPETKHEARAALGLPEGFIAVYTGQLYSYKGADDLLEAAAYLRPGSYLLFVGGRAEEVARLKQRAEQLGLKNAIFAGQVPYARLAIHLRAADVAVLPTRASNRHAAEFLSPIKLFGYFAAGKPVVSTDTPSVREVLDHRAGVFVPPSDPVAMANALNDLTTAPERVTALGKESLRLATNYSWAQRAHDVLEGVAQRKGSLPWHVRYRAELWCAVLAFAIRAIYVTLFPQFKFEGGDGPIYVGLSDFVRGLTQNVPHDLRFYPVVYPHVLAAIRGAFGNDLVWIRLAQSALSAATVFTIAVASHRWLGRRAGWLTGILAAVYAPMVLESGIIYTETTYAFILTIAVITGILAVEQKHLRVAFVSGIAFMLAGLTRELGFYQAAFFGGWALLSRRSWKLAVLLTIPTLLALGGLHVRNTSIAERNALSSQPLVSKNYEKDLFEPTLLRFLFSPSRWHLYAEGAYLYWRFPYRISDLGTGEPIDGKPNPTGDVVYHLSPKAGSFMAIQPVHQIVGKWILVLAHWLLLLFALYGLWRGKLPKEAKIGIMIAVLFAFGTIMLGGLHRVQGFEGFEPLARYRFPTEPLILLLAVAGAQALELRRTR